MGWLGFVLILLGGCCVFGLLWLFFCVCYWALALLFEGGCLEVGIGVVIVVVVCFGDALVGLLIVCFVWLVWL